MKLYRRSLKYAVALTASLLLSWSAAAPSVAQDSASILRVVPYQDVTVFDPITQSTPNGTNYGYMVYDTLFATDADFTPQPQMVDTWEVSEDKMVYTFKLRDGLLFHDGQPVTAEDCIASIKRWGQKDGVGQLLIAATDSMEAIDDKTFKLTLKQPFGMVLDALARSNNAAPFIMPKRFAETTEASKPVVEAIGSGPYKLLKDEWVPGSKIVFAKNEAYVPRKEPASRFAGGKIANFDRVEWLIMSDAATALAALQRGEIDIWEDPPSELVPVIDSSPDIRTSIINQLGRMMHIRPNHLQPPFDNVKARVALEYITSQEEYLAAAVGDPERYQICYAMFYCGGPLATDVGNEPLLNNDPAKAAELFKEAGWDFSKPVTILQATDSELYRNASFVLAQKLRDIGLNPKLEAMDLASLNSRRTNKGSPEEGGWQVFVTGTSPSNGVNPLTSNIAFANCDKAWIGWPCDEELENIRKSFLTLSTIEERRAAAEAFQKRSYALATYIPLGQYKVYVAHSDKVEGILETGENYAYWNITKKD
ncbi:ABC transporter substrate-binding protein [Pseudochelatococcus sp. B33]